MRRVVPLVVLSLTGCLLVASLVSSGRGVSGRGLVLAAAGSSRDTSRAQPLPSSRGQIGLLTGPVGEFRGA